MNSRRVFSASLLLKQEEAGMAEIEKNRELYEIRIKKGQEYRATIDPEKVNSSTEFFSSAYQEAKVQLREILLATIQTEVPETKRLSTKKEIELLRKYPNNVIAFCADRGRGKTTAMLSFSNALDALSGPQNRFSATSSFWRNISEANDNLRDFRFEVLAPVDPAAMENSESVLQQIISQMFENVCMKINSHIEAGTDNHNFNQLAGKFQKCAQAIDSLYKDPKNRTNLIEDELDQIAEIGQSAKLLLLLHELIDGYLDFMREKDGECCLVVQIDDTDMDIGRSFQILEDVRKYLGLPRVIVLMATNIQQLETTVEQHFLQEYKHGLKYPRSMITVERCHDIAVLYLEKAIPHTRRIYLPDIDKTIRQHLSQIRVVYEDADKDKTKDKENNILTSDGTYQKQLLDLLCQKTGMVFTFDEDYLHNLLPKHLRELSQFLSFFANMKDLPDGYELAAEIFIRQGFPDKERTPQILDQWEKNLGRLEFYLVNLWSAINLRENSRNLFLEFVAQPEPIRNLFLLRNIADYYAQERATWENTHPELMWDESACRIEFVRACELQGIDLPSYPREAQGEISTSYADVMGVMSVLTNLPGGDRQYKFAYAIRLFYSIRLHIALIQEIRALGEGIPPDTHENVKQPINFRTLTDLLQDTLLKYGPINDTGRTPFGCWILEMPAQWFRPPLLPKEHILYGRETPFLRRKYRNGNTVYTISTIGPEGVVHKDSGRVSGVWRPTRATRSQEQGEPDIVVFSPLYPLLAVLDRLIRFQNIVMLREDDRSTYKSQIYIALLVCLNWDVQRVLFKEIKTQSGYMAIEMAKELYDQYIPDLLALVPRKVPSWLTSKCFSGICDGENHSVFDVLTKRIHPVPEFETYLNYANMGLAEFDEALSDLQSELKKTPVLTTDKSPSMALLWETTNNNSGNKNLRQYLNKLDSAAGNVLYSIAASQRIEEEVPKRRDNPLRVLLRDFLHNPSTNQGSDRPQFSLEKSSLTPIKVKNALIKYKELLENLRWCEADTPDGKSVEQQLDAPKADVYDGDLSPEAPAPTSEREAAVKTLRELLQLGHQILGVLAPSQQELPSEPEK